MIRRILFACVMFSLPAQAQENEAVVPDEHIREELGVNTYTAPAIADIFKILDNLRPLPFEELRRPLEERVYPNRVQLSMNIGSLIADGFLAVETTKRQEIEDVGRLLLKRSTALGVGDRVTRHSKRLLSLSARGNWNELRSELAKTQSDVENALLELRDEEIAHMIALGGWLRGFEIAVKVVNLNFSEKHAQLLRDIDKIDYFIDRLDTLHPALRKTKLIRATTADLKTLRRILTERPDQALFPSDTKQAEKLITKLNDLMRDK